MKVAIKVFGVMAAAIIYSGCAAERRAPVPTGAMAQKSGENLTVLKRGYGVYKAQCSRCHEPMMPSDISTEEWHVLTPGMAWNAGLSEADEAAVLKYVLAAK